MPYHIANEITAPCGGFDVVVNRTQILKCKWEVLQIFFLNFLFKLQFCILIFLIGFFIFIFFFQAGSIIVKYSDNSTVPVQLNAGFGDSINAFSKTLYSQNITGPTNVSLPYDLSSSDDHTKVSFQVIFFGSKPDHTLYGCIDVELVSKIENVDKNSTSGSNGTNNSVSTSIQILQMMFSMISVLIAVLFVV